MKAYLDRRWQLKRIAVISFACILLVQFVPVYAQTTPTPPRPPTAQEAKWLSEFFDYARQAASTDASTVNSSVLLLGLFNLLFLLVVLIFIWRGGLKPLFDTVNAERKRASNAEKSETQMRTLKDNSERKAEEYRAQTAQSMKDAAGFMKVTAETQERMLTMLNGIESGQQAQTRTDLAIKTINEHTDAALTDTKDKLEAAASHIEAAAQTIGDVVTKDGLDKELKPIHDKLDIIVGEIREVRKKGDTAPLDPANARDTDPALNAAPAPPAEPKPTGGDAP